MLSTWYDIEALYMQSMLSTFLAYFAANSMTLIQIEIQLSVPKLLQIDSIH